MVHGGWSFVPLLIKEKLIDELHLLVNPAVLGNGMPIFQQVTEKQNFDFFNTPILIVVLSENLIL